MEVADRTADLLSTNNEEQFFVNPNNKDLNKGAVIISPVGGSGTGTATPTIPVQHPSTLGKNALCLNIQGKIIKYNCEEKFLNGFSIDISLNIKYI